MAEHPKAEQNGRRSPKDVKAWSVHIYLHQFAQGAFRMEEIEQPPCLSSFTATGQFVTKCDRYLAANMICGGKHMAVDSGLGHRRRIGPHIAGVAVRKVEHEETGLLFDITNRHHRLAEVGLRMARRMRQRHEHFQVTLSPLAYVILDDGVSVSTRPYQSASHFDLWRRQFQLPWAICDCH